MFMFIELAININDEVQVELTKEGEKILVGHFGPNYYKRVEGHAIRIPLWRLMSLFGEHWHVGCANLFEGNVVRVRLEGKE